MTPPHTISRRSALGIPVLMLAPPLIAMDHTTRAHDDFVLYTFGDSILDCGRYNRLGVHPGQLLVRNDDTLFPEFRGKDLHSRGRARLVHCAVDGATVARAAAQARGVKPLRHATALVTVGGNDLLQGLVADKGPGQRAFSVALDQFLARLAVRPVPLGNVYDPTFGNDSRNFLGVDATTARANHRRVNEVIARLARRYGVSNGMNAPTHNAIAVPKWRR